MRIVTALLLLLLSCALQAKDENLRFATLGLGSSSCSDYRAADPQGRLDYLTFIHGYLTAFNLIVPNNYDILEGHAMEEVSEWLQRFCREYPDENFANALAYLTEYYYELREERRRLGTPPSEETQQ